MALKPIKPSKVKRKDSKRKPPVLLQPKPVQPPPKLNCLILNVPD